MIKRTSVPVRDSVAAAVGVLLIHNHKILLAKRVKNAVFEGWQCPGGYLLTGESLEEAAKRICLQKTGLEIEVIQAGPCTNNIFSEQQPVKHTVTLYMLAQVQNKVNSESVNVEAGGWVWYAAEKMPDPLFKPLELLHKQCDIAQLIRR